MREHEYEPIPGLPERLPPGEALLWQGTPRWQAMARRAFHVRKVAIYFAIVLIWRFIVDLHDGHGLASALLGAAWILVVAAAAMGLLVGLAWAMSRATIYSITSHRLVMRIGVALPMIINLPFAQVREAGFQAYADGTGDIPLTLTKEAGTSYMLLWPHARPWRFNPAQPMLRGVPEGAEVARILGDALANYSQSHPEKMRDDESAEDATA